MHIETGHRFAIPAVVAVSALAATSANAQTTTGPDFTSVVNAFTPGTITVGVLAIGAGVMGVYFAIKGIKWLMRAL